jgi:hypothetical protein
MQRDPMKDRPPQRWRPRVAIVAPVKEEEPYLLEWIAYHRTLGVEFFVLGDNGGSDRTSELLQALDAAGVVQRLDWRGEIGFQLRFDFDAIPRLCGVADVCSVTDVDEFLRPLGAHPDIPSAIAGIFADQDVSAAGLSLVNYGSSGRVDPGEGLVIERFTRRGPDSGVIHRVVKSLLRPERLAGVVNPHVFDVTGGSYVNDRGHPIEWDANPATAKSASWHSLRVDHFVVKSRQEFETKARRGRSDLAKGIQDRDEAFFTSRDSNDTFDPMPAEFVLRTKNEIAQLRDRLKRVIADDSPLQVHLSEYRPSTFSN